jgi:hypothetical protein
VFFVLKKALWLCFVNGFGAIFASGQSAGFIKGGHRLPDKTLRSESEGL